MAVCSKEVPNAEKEESVPSKCHTAHICPANGATATAAASPLTYLRPDYISVEGASSSSISTNGRHANEGYNGACTA